MTQHDAGGPKVFKFKVDEKELESSQPRITGLQIKSLAGVDAALGLFLEGRGRDADRPIGDGEVIDLSAPGNERFYTAPPATYGLMPVSVAGIVG